MLQIGSLSLNSPFILAPLSGISDLPFRTINRSFGCELAFTEMIDVHSLYYKSKKLQRKLSTNETDKPLGIQLLGNDPEFIIKALEILQKYEFNLIDLNAACPTKKVVSKGKGACLLKQPKKLQELLAIMVKNTSIPITVKIRSGWDKQSVNAKEVAQYAQDAGIQGLFIHGRTRIQGYSGDIDYKTIGEVKKALHIPVIASGNIFSGEAVKKMFEETGCDAVVIARGALGNPWIFEEMKAYFRHTTLHHGPGMDERTKTMHIHLQLCLDFYGERTGLILFRKFFNWYTKGIPGTKPLREQACHAKTKLEIFSAIQKLCRIPIATSPQTKP
ncbi:MAG: tRNA dihydrouridine synthase DusB [Candidatus Omnitrophota bacterium]